VVATGKKRNWSCPSHFDNCHCWEGKSAAFKSSRGKKKEGMGIQEKKKLEGEEWGGHIDVQYSQKPPNERKGRKTKKKNGQDVEK